VTARFRRSRSRRFAFALVLFVAAGLVAPALPVVPVAPGPAGPGDAVAAPAKKRPATKKRAPAKKPAAPARVEVTLLHTTDLHGHLLPWDYTTGKPDPEVGLSKVATLVRKVRAERGDKVLLVDAGDCIQGTPLAWLHNVGGPGRIAGGENRPDPQMAAMNAMGYDAFTVGNHEYNFGLEVLRRARADAKFPWLSANTLKDGPSGEAAYQSYLVREIGGVRIGILGLTTPGVPHWDDGPNWSGLRFEDPLESARRWVPILRGMERCDAVVVVCHMGMEEDAAGRPRPGQMPNENRVLAIAREVKGIDAIVMGHTHTKVPSQRVNDVVLTQAGRWGEALGRLDLTFDRQEDGTWRLSDRQARLLAVDASVASDPAVEAIVRPYHDDTEAMLRTVIAEATAPFDGGDARLRDNALHELIHRAQLAASGADVSLSAMFNPRARVAAGPITVRDAFSIYPYENTLATVELKGVDLAEALEHSSRYYSPYDFGRTGAPAIDPGVAGYNFDTAEGVTYTLDLSQPIGKRVRDLRWRGEKLAPDQKLKVAVNNYRMNGGGGYVMLQRGTRVPGPVMQAREAVVEYLKREKRVTPTTDGNWRLVPEWVPSPAKEPLERLVRRGVVPADSALVYQLDAPLSHRRFADWVMKLGAPDPLKVEGKDRKRKAAELPDPASALSLPRALEWAATVLPAERRSPVVDPADPWRLAPGGTPEARAEFAGGRRLTVAEGAALLADVAYPRLTFLHISDFHGALLGGASDRVSQRPWGGAAVLAAHLARERAKNPEGTIVTDGGDWMQGTPLSNLRFGKPVIELMNRERLDAAAIGNHEFDWSADTLRARLAEARFAALGANWMDKATGRRVPDVAPWTMVSRRGIDVGILGLCTEHTPQTTLPQHVRDYAFPDAARAAAALEDSVWAAGAEVLLAIGHLPGRQDSTGKVTGELADVAKALDDEIAVFGGHSHNRVLARLDDGVAAIIPYAHGTHIGRLDVVFDRRKLEDGKPLRPIAEETGLALVPTFADEVRPDAAITTYLAEANTDIEPIMARVLGDAGARMGRSRARDSDLGNWVTDAMRGAVGADLAFQNPGGIRADLEAGPVTVGEVYEIMPFDNRVATVRLSGKQVLELLEAGVSPQTCIQVSGLSFAFDPLRPRGERVIDVKLADGSPFDRERTYLVATNDFMAQGGDGFTVLAEGKDLTVTGLLMRDVLEQDLMARAKRGEKLVSVGGKRIENRGSMALQQAAERR
jgi:2',3'-cyclic-nucleotide 2'-phosphodiesterase/3'-nucleotidase/5'-nucleotidase